MSPERASGAMIAPPSVSGLQSVAGAVRSIADRELKQKERMLEMDEANKLLEIESEYNQMMAKTKNGFSINNPDSWQYDDAHNAYIDAIDYTGARPEFQQRVKLSLAQRKARLDEGLIGEKFATKAKIFTGNVQNQIAMALDVNDYQGARDTLAKYGPAMRLRSDELEKMQLNIDRAERNASIEDMIAEGDVDGIKSLQGISSGDMLRYSKAAEGNKLFYEKQALSDISDKITTKKITDKNSLEEALKNPRISEASAVVFLSNWENDQPLSWDEKSNLTQSLNSLYNQRKTGLITDEEYARKHHDLAAKVFALADRPGTGALRKRVYDLDPSGWSNGVPGGGKKTEIDILVEDVVKGFVKHGGAGKGLAEDKEYSPKEKNAADIQRDMFHAELLRNVQAEISNYPASSLTAPFINELTNRIAIDMVSGVPLSFLDKSDRDTVEEAITGGIGAYQAPEEVIKEKPVEEKPSRFTDEEKRKAVKEKAKEDSLNPESPNFKAPPPPTVIFPPSGSGAGVYQPSR